MNLSQEMWSLLRMLLVLAAVVWARLTMAVEWPPNPSIDVPVVRELRDRLEAYGVRTFADYRDLLQKNPLKEERLFMGHFLASSDLRLPERDSDLEVYGENLESRLLQQLALESAAYWIDHLLRDADERRLLFRCQQLEKRLYLLAHVTPQRRGYKPGFERQNATLLLAYLHDGLREGQFPCAEWFVGAPGRAIESLFGNFIVPVSGGGGSSLTQSGRNVRVGSMSYDIRFRPEDAWPGEPVGWQVLTARFDSREFGYSRMRVWLRDRKATAQGEVLSDEVLRRWSERVEKTLSAGPVRR